MFKKILFATTATSACDNAAHVAFDLARKKAFDISRKALWSNLIENYKMAFDVALHKAQKREETQSYSA